MRVCARLFYSIFTRLTGVDLHGASDFKLMDRRVLDAWQRLGEHILFFRGMNAWLGFRRVQLPFDVAERSSGQTGWSLVQRTKLAMTAVTSFSSHAALFDNFPCYRFCGIRIRAGPAGTILQVYGACCGWLYNGDIAHTDTRQCGDVWFGPDWCLHCANL